MQVCAQGGIAYSTVRTNPHPEQFTLWKVDRLSAFFSTARAKRHTKAILIQNAKVSGARGSIAYSTARVKRHIKAILIQNAKVSGAWGSIAYSTARAKWHTKAI